MTIKPWKCDKCDFAHAVKNGLAEHKKLSHAKESDKLSCPQCEYKTPSKQGLKKHIGQVHDKVVNFTCDQCAMGFFAKTTLQLHIKSKYKIRKRFLC